VTTLGEEVFNRFLRFLAKVGLVSSAFKTSGAIVAFIRRFL
jgi:hypothetical protein